MVWGSSLVLGWRVSVSFYYFTVVAIAGIKVRVVAATVVKVHVVATTVIKVHAQKPVV